MDYIQHSNAFHFANDIFNGNKLKNRHMNHQSHHHNNNGIKNLNNASFMANSNKLMKQNQRNSIDYGYESFLSSTVSSSLSTSSFLNQTQPSTPVKSTNTSTCYSNVTTPDYKQKYYADVNGIYLASIASPSKSSTGHVAINSVLTSVSCSIGSTASTASSSSTSFMFQSPIKSNFSFNSATNSPVKLINSPKFLSSAHDYIHERNIHTAKLLRSPAFKLSSNGCVNVDQEEKMDTSCRTPHVQSFNKRFETVYKKTPTEEEFMDLLFRNHHLPNNPEFLIGRHMGLEHIDILNELNKRSLNDPMDIIFSYLDAADLVKVASVSRDWRQIVRQNKRANKKRSEFIKEKKEIFETSKENNNLTQMSRLAERRNLFKRIKQLNSTDGSLVFASLDHNCLDAFASEVKRAGKSLMHSIDNTYQNNDECKRVQQAVKFVESSPKLLSKRMSPYKSPRKSAAFALKMMNLNSDVDSKKTTATLCGPGSGSNKIDLIGSKKSKRNLKRL